MSLVSRGSLERLRDEVGGEAAQLDGRRFRMLFEIDGVTPHEEDSWIGTEIRIGQATVLCNGDIGRCVITSRDPDSGVIDVPTLAVLANYRPEGRPDRQPIGIYGALLAPGREVVGDTVTP